MPAAGSSAGQAKAGAGTKRIRHMWTQERLQKGEFLLKGVPTERTLLVATRLTQRDISEPFDGRCGRGAGRRREDGRGVARRRSGLLKWLRKPLRSHIRGAISPRGNALAVPRPVSPLHLVQSVRPSSPAHRESGGRTAMVQVDYQFASEKKDVEISAERSSRLGRC